MRVIIDGCMNQRKGDNLTYKGRKSEVYFSFFGGEVGPRYYHLSYRQIRYNLLPASLPERPHHPQLCLTHFYITVITICVYTPAMFYDN